MRVRSENEFNSSTRYAEQDGEKHVSMVGRYLLKNKQNTDATAVTPRKINIYNSRMVDGVTPDDEKCTHTSAREGVVTQSGRKNTNPGDNELGGFFRAWIGSVSVVVRSVCSSNTKRDTQRNGPNAYHSDCHPLIRQSKTLYLGKARRKHE